MNSSMCKADNTWHEFKTCCPSPPPFSPPTSSGPFTRLSACGREESSAMKCRESLWDLMRSEVQMLPHSHTFQFLQLIYFPMSILNAKSQNNREIMTRKNRKERLLNFKITMFWTTRHGSRKCVLNRANFVPYLGQLLNSCALLHLIMEEKEDPQPAPACPSHSPLTKPWLLWIKEASSPPQPVPSTYKSFSQRLKVPPEVPPLE